MKKKGLIVLSSFVLLITSIYIAYADDKSDIILRADAIEYTVAFDLEDGAPYSEFFKTTVEEGALITITPPDPIKAGYTFIGWAYAFDGDMKPLLWNFEEDIVIENTTLWAYFEEDLTVTYDPDDGSGYPTWFKTTVPYGGLVEEKPVDPIKDGYTFVGWAYAFDGDMKPLLWNFEEDIVIENTTLWAYFEEDLTVTYDPDDGSGYPTWFKTTVPYGGLVEEKPVDPIKDGYTFVGWAKSYDENMDPIFWNFEEDRVYDNTTLWAHFEEDLTVTYDPDDGSGYPTWFKTTVPYGGLVEEKPVDPIKDGYVFEGWYGYMDENNEPVYWNFEEDRVYENTTLWAHYVKADQERVTVTFDPQNGTDPTTWIRITIPKGTKIPSGVKIPERLGYILKGWSIDKSKLVTWQFDVTEVNEDMTLYGIWEKEEIDKPVTPETPDPEKPTLPEVETEKPVTKEEEKLPQTGVNSNFYDIGALVTLGTLLVAKKPKRKRSK